MKFFITFQICIHLIILVWNICGYASDHFIIVIKHLVRIHKPHILIHMEMWISVHKEKNSICKLNFHSTLEKRVLGF